MANRVRLEFKSILAGAGIALILILNSCSSLGSTDVEAGGSLGNATNWDVPGTQKSDLFVFVGENIEVVEIKEPDRKIAFDQEFNAKYRVVERVYGEFDGSIIEFKVFDHYGFPPFANHRYALLFVSKHEDRLYHEKYQYHAVDQTVDGRWAACGDPYFGMEYHRKPFTPKALTFEQPVTFELGKHNKEYIKARFTEPYFEIADGKAVCKMGAFVDELFQINRDGVLKARGVGQ